MNNIINEINRKDSYKFDDLVKVMDILRSESGCPWDREQTHQSIRNDFLEEAYEAIEGIDKSDDEILCEELGDVLLQVVFHAKIANEQGSFDIDDVCDGICKKLILRHPHIFSDVKADTSDEVLKNWDEIKRKEKNQKTDADALRAISNALPALVRAKKIQSKKEKFGCAKATKASAAKSLRDISLKLADTLENGSPEILSDMFGELLYAVTDAARISGINAEQALFEKNLSVVEDFEKEKNRFNCE